MRSRLVLLAAALSLAAACTRGPSPAAARDAGPPPRTDAPPGAVATFGEHGVVTAARFRAARAALPPDLRARARTREGAEELVRSLAATDLLVAEAERRGLGDGGEVRATLERHRERVLIEALFADEARARADAGAPPAAPDGGNAAYDALVAALRAKAAVKVDAAALDRLARELGGEPAPAR